MTNLESYLAKLEAADKARTPGRWGWMFIGGPLNPEHIDVYTVGLEGSHHIKVSHHRKYERFKKGDAEFIAKTANEMATLIAIAKEAVEALRFYSSASELDSDGYTKFETDNGESADETLARIEKLAGGRNE